MISNAISQKSNELSATLSSRAAVQSSGNFEDITSNCIEDIQFSGVYHFVDRLTITPSGRLSIGVHLDAQGSGIGLDSGAKYLWRDNWTEQINVDLSSVQENVTFRHSLKLIGTGGAESATFTLIIKFLINNNGTLVLDSFSADFPC